MIRVFRERPRDNFLRTVIFIAVRRQIFPQEILERRGCSTQSGLPMTKGLDIFRNQHLAEWKYNIRLNGNAISD